jgi:hypothetical protein
MSMHLQAMVAGWVCGYCCPRNSDVEADANDDDGNVADEDEEEGEEDGT